MTYLGHCDLERSIAPPPTVQYISYIVTKRALLSCLLIFFNENLKNLLYHTKFKH